MTQTFLMMGETMNQGVPRNSPNSHISHQILILQLPHTSVAKVIPREILILGESSNIFERHSQNNGSIAKMGEEKT